MNKCILIGRLSRDPDARQSGELNITRFTVAVDRRQKAGAEKTADFISCVAFGKTAEFIAKYFKQGVKIAVDGRIQTGSYTDKDGNKKYTTDVVADNVEFADSKRVEETPPPSVDEYITIPEGIENDLPFK